mmetsp:Transcript_215/g.584  ORF Transcript_215/g.584 Transcript_215/m.584 type:complete len:290 (+) Transcript_215:181-1050(+)
MKVVSAAATAGLAAAAASTRKVYVVTGATDGIGRLTAQRLGADGHHVAVHGRTQSKCDAVVRDIEKSGGEARSFVADLSSVAETRRLGQELAGAYPAIDGLLNNAGTFSGDYTGSRVVTADGHEYSLAVNVLAPFLLTSLLLENVRASGAGRILVTSSMSMGAGDALDDLECERWSEHRAYSLSKLCCAMIAMELDARYGDAPRLCVNTMDPGTVNTKMLFAGWGRCGIPVESATQSYKMLVEEAWGTKSGQCAGTSMDRECTDPAKRRKLWDDLTAMTNAEYPPTTQK